MIHKTEIPVGKYGDRARRIETAGLLLIGRDPDDPTKPMRGWEAALSRAMGMGRTAINDTKKVENSEIFDRKLADFVGDRRLQMIEDIKALETLERILRSNDPNRYRYDDAWAPEGEPK